MSDKPHKSLETRAMRKAVERVDIGAFGAPLKAVNWIKSKKATWGGWAIVSLIQALVGAGIGYGLMSIFGIPFNVLSSAIYICFIIGSAIGGPFVFTIWTLLLVGLTHVIAGSFVGAWIGSADWWSKLVAMWNSGKSIPGWFQAAVPIWMFIWVIASRGIAKGADILLEKIALALGFRAASRFSNEEKQVYDDAFRESDVSPTETQSLMESSNDGTHAVIAGETLMQRDRPETFTSDPHNDGLSLHKPTLADGGLDYDNLLDDGASDPEVSRAIGARGDEEDVTIDNSLSDEGPEEATLSSDNDAPVLIEMSPTKLPDVPRDNAPPIRRVSAPEVDFRANRALHRRMGQLLFGFNKYRHEDREAEYIQENVGELSSISDEQRRVLEGMADSGPLLAVIGAIQQKNAESFLANNGEPAIIPGTGSIDGPIEEDDADIVKPLLVDDLAIEDEEAETEVQIADVPAKGSKADIASMAASFSKALTARRGGTAKDEDASDLTVATSEAVATEILPAEAEIDPVEAEAQTGDVDAEIKADESADVVAETPAETQADDVDADQAVTSSTDPVAEVSQANAMEVETSAETITTESAEGEEFTFDVALEKDENPEDELSNKDFGRVLCRQVFGIVDGSHDPSIKAEDVTEFERQNPETSIGEIINSRSFDEHVGNVEASNARRQWREIREILSQSSGEKLVADLEKVNIRGENLYEMPSELNEVSFNLFERDSVRIRSLIIASKDDQVMAEASSLLSRNILLIDMLKKILDDREKESRRMTRPSSQPGGVVRQKIVKSDDSTVERGRSIASSVFKRAGADGAVLRPVDAEVKAEAVPDAEEVEAAPEIHEAHIEDNAMPTAHVPALGEEGYVSPYQEGTREYERDMQKHSVQLEMNKQFAEEDRQMQEDAARRAADEAAAQTRMRDENDAEIRRMRAEAESRRIADEEASRAAVAAQREREAKEKADAAAEERESQRLIRENARSLQHRTQADNILLNTIRGMQRTNVVPERFYEAVMAHVLSLNEMRTYSRSLKAKRTASEKSAEGLSEAEILLANPSERLSLMIEAQMGDIAVNIIKNIAEMLDVDPDDAEKLANMMDDETEVDFLGRMNALVDRRTEVNGILTSADETSKELLKSVQVAAEAEDIKERLSLVEKTASETQALLEQEKAAAEKIKSDLDAALVRAAAAEKLIDRMEKEKAGIIDDDFQAILDKHATVFSDEGAECPGVFVLYTKDKTVTNIIITAPMDAFPSGIARLGDDAMPISDLVTFVIGKKKIRITKSERVLILDSKLRAYLEESGFVLEDITRSVPSLEEILGVKFED